MTRIIIVCPSREILIGSFPVENEAGAKRLEKMIESWKKEYGELERLIVSMGTVRILEPDAPIPVPPRWARAGS